MLHDGKRENEYDNAKRFTAWAPERDTAALSSPGP